jgi:mono/diheme cytochrome c family protein
MALGGLLYVYSGSYNIAASKPGGGFDRWLVGTLSNRSITVAAAQQQAVSPADSLFEGYHGYTAQCVMCHGSPIDERWEGARYMAPLPPTINEAAELWDFEQLVWIVHHGLAMSAMPSFGSFLSRESIIEIASFVDSAGTLSQLEYQELARGFEASLTDTSSSDGVEGPRSDTGRGPSR